MTSDQFANGVRMQIMSNYCIIRHFTVMFILIHSLLQLHCLLIANMANNTVGHQMDLHIKNELKTFAQHLVPVIVALMRTKRFLFE